MSTPNSPGRHLRGRVSVSLLVVVAGIVLVAFVASRVVGAAQGLAVGVGGAVVALFFGTGLAIMSAALKFHPRAALVLALMTYVLQMALVTLVFVALDRGGLLGDAVDATWLTVTVAALTVLVTAGLMWWAMHVRVPIYDLDDSRPAAPDATPAGTSSKSPSGTLSRTAFQPLGGPLGRPVQRAAKGREASAR